MYKKQQKKTFRRALMCAAFLIYTGHLFASDFSIENIDISFLLQPQLESPYVTGKSNIDFSASYVIQEAWYTRINLTLQYADFFSFLPPQSKSGTFSFNTVYAAYIFPHSVLQQTAGIFAGYYEPVGTDIFSQKQFELEDFTPSLKTNIFGATTTISDPHGIGVHYSILLPVFFPLAGDISIYWNAPKDAVHIFSQDIRLAAAFDSAVLDISAGLSEQFSTSKVFARFSGTVLAGKQNTTHLYIQAGVSDFDISKAIPVDTIYAFFEPRLVFDIFRLHLSFFKFPMQSEEQIDKLNDLLFISNPIGFDIMPMFTPHMDNGLRIGAHFTASFPLKNAFESNNIKDIIFQISPFMECSIGMGVLRFAFTVSPLQFADIDTIKIHAGYKVVLK